MNSTTAQYYCTPPPHEEWSAVGGEAQEFEMINILQILRRGGTFAVEFDIHRLVSVSCARVAEL